MALIVTAGYVSVETAVPGGRAVVDIPRGAELPADVPDEQIRNLTDLGRITEQPEPGESDTPAEAQELPSGPPPRRGPGSGVHAWEAYAHSYGVLVPDGSNRDQIRDLLTEHGIPVE